jgi:hypothetical protein
MQTVNIFPKTLRFFTASFNQANNVYVKIYKTNYVLCFFQSKNKYPRYLCANVLWVAFLIPSGSLSVVILPCILFF